jgi:hypothetical protein
MLRIQPLVIAAFLLTLGGCNSDNSEPKAEDSSATPDVSSDAEWEELGEDNSSQDDDDDDDDDDEKDDTGKDEFTACGDEVQTDAACEGDWEDTLCVDDEGVFWWCDGGVWTADKDR